MDFFENRNYRTQKVFMQLIGYWPEEHPVARFVKFTVILGFIVSFINVQIFNFFVEKVTLELIIRTIPHVSTCCIAIVKYLTYLVEGNFIRNVVHYIKNVWDELRDETEIGIFQKIAEDARMWAILIMSFCLCGVGCLVFVDYRPMVLDFVLPLNKSRPRFHPFKVEYFVDEDEYFHPILMHLHTSSLITVFVIASSDALTITILFHICGMFAITGHRLQYAFEEVSVKADEAYEAQVFCVKLVRAVKYHRKTLQFTRFILNKFIAFYILQLVLVVIALTGILLDVHIALLKMEDIGLIIMDSFRLIGHFVVAFFNILPGQRIFDYSENLLIQAYDGCWYRAPLKAQKVLLFIMRRTIEPFKMTAGNIIDMTFETYSSIVQMTISYFMLIHSIQQ